MKKIIENNNILYQVEKDFPIAGVNFVDLTPTLTTPSHFKMVANMLVSKINEESPQFDYIISPDARGFLWGSYVAALMDKPLIPVRKRGKLPESSVMATIKYATEYSSTELDLPKADLTGKRCIFIDDVYATGGTYKACQELVTSCGGMLDDAYVILNVLLTKDYVKALMTSDELDFENKDFQEEEKIKIKLPK